MDHLIYTAVSGATRNLNQQQISANNLSNANSEGFRGDLERASAVKVTGSGYDSRYLVTNGESGVDLTPGAIYETGNGLDVAIKGNGLFVLQDGNREVYTRNGAFDVDSEGNLTLHGLPVVGETGPIILPPFSSVSVGDDGTITIVPLDGDVAAPMDVDRLKLVEIPGNQLNKNQDGLLTANMPIAPRSDMVEVVGEHLEGSNVSAIQEMITTVSLNRQFEAQIKMMKAAENLAQAGNRLIRGS